MIKILKVLFDIGAICVVAMVPLYFLANKAKEMGAKIDGFEIAISSILVVVSSFVILYITSLRGNKRDIIRTTTSFCDELMNDSCKYLSKRSDENEMKVLGCRITSYNKLIEDVIQDNFSYNTDIKEASENVNKFVDDVKKLDPSSIKLGTEGELLINSIIQLRIIVFKQQNRGLCDEIFDGLKILKNLIFPSNKKTK